jgi:tRNA threonylcarbamoyladenosine biosynthesis protein TsaB
MKPELFKGALDVKLRQTTSFPSQVDKAWLCAGNAWHIYDKQLASLATQCIVSKYYTDLEKFSYPDAQYIAYLAFKEIQDDSLVDAAQASPVYLRNNVAKKPKK